MLVLTPLLIAVAGVVASVLYRKLRYARLRQYACFPQHPTDLVWGHLRLMGNHIRRHKPDAHIDMAFADMHRALGSPPLMFLDSRPLNEPVLLVANYETADLVIKASDRFPTSPPKPLSSLNRLFYLFGPTSLFAETGEDWKRLRKRFNPGFAPSYLASFTPDILDKGLIFLDRLDALAKSADTFPLMHYTTRLTFDVIGKVVMEADFDAQRDDHEAGPARELIRLYEALLEAYSGEHHNLPWWLTPKKVWRRSGLASQVCAVLSQLVRAKHAELQTEKASSKPARSVLSLSLKDVDVLTPKAVDETVDQLRTFLFAGHDTTSILISWALYELSRTPRALAAVRAELDTVLGADATDPPAVRARILDRDPSLQHMPYIAAVVKETLRLHPPAGASRVIPPGTNYMLPLPDGGQQCIDGMLVYSCHKLIHTDRRIFGDTAEHFAPERWLDERAATIPAGAWRPYERGPRNCIGQDLANLEARAIIALAARRYDFVKVGLGQLARDGDGEPRLDVGSDQYEVVEELYDTRQVTSKPVDGMLMRVKLAG